MSIVAQAGIFGFGPQAGKEVSASTLYKHRASDIDLAAISDDRLGPPEVGGTPVPTVPYRAGIIAAGGATIAPRLENTFGWLLQGVAGDCTTSSNEDVFGTTATDFYHHEFAFDTTSEGYVPWMTFYKEIPAATSTDRFGETYEDCKVVNMTLTLPNDGLIQSRIDVIGRMADNTTQWEDNPSKVFGNTDYEDFESIPIGSNTGGYIQIPDFSGEDLPVVQATVSFQNAPLDIRQEKVYGSPYLEDVTIIGRALTLDMVVKWQDASLYRSILTGSTTATTWQCAPFVSDLDIYGLTCEDSLGAGTPWQIRVTAPKVMYQLAGGIRLAGNEAVMMRLTGTAIKGTEDYFTIHLGNTTASYVWPSGGS
jgi:hypothetical protein